MQLKYKIIYLFISTFLFADPDWYVDEGAYDYWATLRGAVILNNGQSLAEVGDIFAAFDEDENVRGVAGQLTPEVGPYEGEIVYEMQLRSNDEGDLLSFKYYDASEDIILDIIDAYEFIINDILGNVTDPIF